MTRQLALGNERDNFLSVFSTICAEGRGVFCFEIIPGIKRFNSPGVPGLILPVGLLLEFGGIWGQAKMPFSSAHRSPFL